MRESCDCVCAQGGTGSSVGCEAVLDESKGCVAVLGETDKY